MPTYTYKALELQGRQREGTMASSSRREALQRLMTSGLYVMSLREQAAEGAGKARGFPFRKRPIRLSVFTRQLGTLSASGVPLVQSLNAVMEQTPDPRAQQILVSLRESVHGGSTFADALEQRPDVFPKVLSSMVRVGEMAGTFDEVLAQLSELFEKEEDLRREVRAAMAYPALVLCLGLASAILLMTFMIPRLETLFEGVSQGLPLPTRVLLGISHFLAGYGWLLALALLGVFAWWRAAARSALWRLRIDAWKLRIPWVGKFVRTIAVGRFARLLGTLTNVGMPVVDGLEIVGPALGNAAFSNSIRQMAVRIRGGESLASVMREHNLFPPLPVQMVRVGEETGHLGPMLLRVADAYDRETATSTKMLTSLIAPVMILLIAGLVGFIILSMMLPIFKLSSVLA